MAGVIYKGVRATDGRKVQLTPADNPENTAGGSINTNELGAAGGIATLDGSSLVVQNPASADGAANPNTIPIRDANGDVFVPVTPTAVGAATSKAYVDNLVIQGRAWKELLLIPEQLATGASGGIKQAMLIAITAELTVGDTFEIDDGVTNEQWTAVAGAPAAFQFQLGGTAAATTTNLVAAIVADSTLWEAVETTGLDGYFSGANDPQFVVQRQVPSEGNADRVYGVISNGQADVQVAEFGAGALDYATPASSQNNLFATDPGIQLAGFGRITANLIAGETHITVENNSTNTWDGDDQVWQQTAAGQTLDGAGLSLTANVLNVGDVNRGVQVNADDLEIDASEIAGDGLVQNGSNSWQLDTDVTVPKWRKFTVAATAFTAAAATEDIELLSLPAGGIIQGVKIKHSTAFSGGTLSALTLSVGIVGVLDKYASAFDVFQAVADTTFQVSNSFGSEDHGSATSIRLAASATGDTLDNVGTGSVDVWVLYSVAV